jgi:hypothetical protein
VRFTVIAKSLSIKFTIVAKTMNRVVKDENNETEEALLISDLQLADSVLS